MRAASGTRVKGDSYRRLSIEDKEQFRSACRAGIDPKVICPLCGGARLTTTREHRYDDDAKDWIDDRVRVDCHTCKVRYRVLLKEADRD